MKQKLFILILIPILLLSACNLPSSSQQGAGDEGLIFTQAAQTITAAAEVSQTPTVSEIGTFTPIPTDTALAATQPATATGTSIPCNFASFVSDVTIPDNTSITVNQGFTKTWRLKNVGSCTWTSGYQLVFDSGDQMGGPASQQLTNGSVAPGQTIDVSVNLTAPASPGTYKGNWKLREPGGALFGLSTGAFWVQIKAESVASVDWPIYKNGDTGVEVFAIQHLLTARGHNTNADGIFGPNTKANVQAFQTSKGLLADGIVGPNTWQALIIQVSQGKTGPEVRAVQRLLKDKFGYGINVDGIFGPDTATAVKAFQNANGLAVDGIVGPNTWKKLISN
jgi:hypothetical protein